MSCLRFIFGLMVLLGIGAGAGAADETKRVALLVGIDHYQKRGFMDLKCAENDMKAMAAELKQLDFEVRVLAGSAVGESKATLENIRRQLDLLLVDVGKNDVVLVAFAGHGLQFTVQRDGGEPREEAFCCPVDAVFGEPQTMLSLRQLVDETLSKRGGRNIVLVDACRNPPSDPGRSLSSGIEGRLLGIPEDTAVFFSCRAGQQSFEEPEKLNHGIFSYAVVRALRELKAAGSPIRWFDLVARVTQNFQAPEILSAIPKERVQEPILAGNMPDFIFALGRLADPRIVLKPATTASISGVWSGKYFYPAYAEREPVAYSLFLIQQGGLVTGAMRERNTFGNAGFPFLYATVHGDLNAAGKLSFRKTYDGTASVNHFVDYQGQLSTDATRLTSGSWSIPDDWGGSMTMAKVSGDQPAPYTGIWYGTYYYMAGEVQQPVNFQLTLLQSGNRLTGFIKEPNTFGKVNTPWLYATVAGGVDPATGGFFMTKTYDGTAGENHDVAYRGSFSADKSRALNGRWEIRADWNGKFDLRKFFP